MAGGEDGAEVVLVGGGEGAVEADLGVVVGVSVTVVCINLYICMYPETI